MSKMHKNPQDTIYNAQYLRDARKREKLTYPEVLEIIHMYKPTLGTYSLAHVSLIFNGHLLPHPWEIRVLCTLMDIPESVMEVEMQKVKVIYANNNNKKS